MLQKKLNVMHILYQNQYRDFILDSVSYTENLVSVAKYCERGRGKNCKKNLHVMHILYHNVSLNKKCIALKVATPFIDKKIAAAAVTLQIYNW